MIKVKFKLKIDKYGWEPGLLSITVSPYDAKEISSSLSPYQRVTVDRTLFAEGQEFLHIDQSWVGIKRVHPSEEDNRIQKVPSFYQTTIRMKNYSIYVKQLEYR